MPADDRPQRPVPLILLIGSVFLTITVVEVLARGLERNWIVSLLLLVGEFAIGVVLAVAIWTLVVTRRS
ncbi:hypothetical protein [Catenuloplanes atrovinosus]|uniref:NhaP-type Na+/H+ and K+/H+ antiporter n=1 Tax=Catenuloplanes atrovinosus TaxID=137266 RepID=A0AAE3YS27_9ACTN|nr:hypothetical protein [Catenuloplanes atrovinosus]MDR7276741.1 NhaP-type Na+/H+ and K+/H+ antiporter [Catenuloplanes atrovinosus]